MIARLEEQVTDIAEKDIWPNEFDMQVFNLHHYTYRLFVPKATGTEHHFGGSRHRPAAFSRREEGG